MMNEHWLGTNCRGWYNWTQLLHPISVIFYICYNYQARHSTFLTIRDILFDFLRKKYLLCDFGTIFAFQHSFDPFSSETILNGWKFLSCKFITYYCVILCKSSNLNFKLGYLFSVIFIRHQMCQCWGDLGFIILIFLNGISLNYLGFWQLGLNLTITTRVNS